MNQLSELQLQKTTSFFWQNFTLISSTYIRIIYNINFVDLENFIGNEIFSKKAKYLS